MSHVAWREAVSMTFSASSLDVLSL